MPQPISAASEAIKEYAERRARRNYASVVKKVADWIDNNDPFGDHFSAHDLEQLRALEKALA